MTERPAPDLYTWAERLVLDTVAATTQLDRAALDARTPLLEAHLDSLTLLAVLARIEAAGGVVFADEELLEWLGAVDLGALAAHVARKVAAARSSESR
jgi:acyl carrier protein